MASKDVACVVTVFIWLVFVGIPKASSTACSSALGAQYDGSLNSTSFSSSSDYSTYTAAKARMNGSVGWVPKSWSDINAKDPEYLQIDFLAMHRFSAIETKGLPLMAGFYISSFKLASSVDGITFTQYMELGEVKTFEGNADSATVKFNAISCPMEGRYLRVIPSGFGTGIGLQVEVYGCQNPLPSAMLSPIKDLGVVSISSNKVLVQWNASKDSYQHYVITLEALDTVQGSAQLPMRRLTVLKDKKTQIHVQELDQLTACTLYRIVIKPFGVCGEGKISQISATTNPMVPPKPTILSALSLEALKVHMIWEDGLQDIRCISNVSGYIVQYKPVMSSDAPINRTVLLPNGLTSRRTIELANLNGWTKYEIVVVAFGPYGQSAGAATQVDVDGKAPSEGPTITKLVCTQPNSFTVNWKNPSSDKVHGTIRGFSIHYKPVNESLWLSVAPQSLQTTAVFNDLQPWQTYDVFVMLHINKYNSSSKQEQVLVMGPAPYKGPNNVKVQNVKATSLSLVWDALPDIYFRGVFDGYYVHYRQSGTDVVKSMMTMGTTAELSQLLPATEYSITITSTANGKESPRGSVIIAMTTNKLKPLAAPQVTGLGSPVAGSLVVTWTLPSGVKDNTRLTLLWRSKQSTGPWSERELLTTLTGLTLNNLQPWQEYEIQLRLSRDSETYNSTVSSVLVVDNVPGHAPGNVKVASKSPGTVHMSWDPINPRYMSPSFSGYIVSYQIVGPQQFRYNTTTPSHSITVSSLTGGTAYSFSVAGMSRFGTGPRSSSAVVSVKKRVTPPRTPIIVSLVARSSATVRVTWRQPEELGVLVDKFLITAITPSNQRHELWYTATGGNKLYQTTIVGLRPFTRYAVSVRATTDYRGMDLSSKSSDVKSVVTMSAAPSIPRNVTITPTGHSALIQWLPPAETNGVVSKYTLSVRDTRSNSLINNMPLDVTARTLRVEISHLDAFTNYTVEITASTTETGPGQVNYFVSAEGVPSPPRNVSAKANSTHILIRWMKPGQPKGKVEEYRINYVGSKPRETPSVLRKVFIPGDRNDHALSNVIPGANYEIQVAAKTSRGYGSNSRAVAVSTPIRVPVAPPPPAVDLDTVTSSAVTIELKAETGSLDSISSYQVIVERLQGQLRRRRSSSPLPQVLLGYADAKARGMTMYIAAEVKASVLPLRFAIGDGNHYNGFYNAPLHPNSAYRTHVRATTTDANGVVFPGDASSIDLPVTAPRVGTSPTEESFKIPLSVIAGASGGVLLLIIIIVIIILYLRSSNASRKRGKQGADPYDLELSKTRLHSETDGQRPTSLTGDAPLHPDHPPIAVGSFQKHVNKLHKCDNSGFKNEYNQLEIGKEFSWEIAHLGCNKTKNRYANIVAYDHSRVLLEDVDDEIGSNYINASYIDGYMRPNAYVATQGPLPSTFDDFWRMMWELRSNSIVMLTNLQEKNKLKCHKYWPDDETEYGKMRVAQTKKELYADYTIRTFKMQRRGTEETREVKQFHFTVWPDHGVPQYATAILAFRRRARAFLQIDDTGPTVVHCSAGVGRTGTYIAIDATLDRMTKQGDIDIFNFIAAMRTRRIAMVQTEEQYIFVHDAVLEAIICGNTEIPVQDLRASIMKLERTETDSKMSGFEKEWKTLNTVSPILPKTAFTVALLTDNVNKNRYSCVVPADLGRVELLPIDDDVATTYINAVYIDGYKQRNAFILTQSPLPNTTADFWRMLSEHKSGSVVMLNNLEEGDDYTRFWPDRQRVDYEMISVESLSETVTTSIAGKVSLKATNRHCENEIIIRKFEVTDSRNPDSHFFVKVFQYLGWAETKAPPNCKAVISLAGLIEKWQQRSGNGPITIMCSDGLGRSGTFAGLVAVLERLKVEQVVDVFQTVKAMRIQRPHLVKYLDQYKFIHHAVQEYLSAFDDYANFK